MADKFRERALVEKARRLYPWFPLGEIREFEKPDFVVVDGEDRIGIEVTELFQPPKHGSKFGPHVVAKLHQRILERAEQRAQSIRPVDVLVYFDYRHKFWDSESAADALIEFVRTHPNGTYGMIEKTPAGFSVVRIADPTANVIPGWRCGDSGETVEATHGLIAEVIAKKNPRVPLYRTRVPRVFLLIASNFADFANNFYVGGNVNDWQFDFDFDKVLLLTSEQGVFDLLRRQP